jgi:hypothetical protein
MSLASRSRLIAATLTIGAIAAPAASARFDLEPHQRLYVNPSTGYATPVPLLHNQVTGPRPEVHANPDQQTPQTSRGAPPILRPARPSDLPAINRAQEQEAQRRSYTLPRTARYSNAEMNAYASAVHPVAVSTPVSDVPSNAFDYGAAAIGAGITGAIVLLITAGTLTIRRRSQPRHP